MVAVGFGATQVFPERDRGRQRRAASLNAVPRPATGNTVRGAGTGIARERERLPDRRLGRRRGQHGHGRRRIRHRRGAEPARTCSATRSRGDAADGRAHRRGHRNYPDRQHDPRERLLRGRDRERVPRRCCGAARSRRTAASGSASRPTAFNGGRAGARGRRSARAASCTSPARSPPPAGAVRPRVRAPTPRATPSGFGEGATPIAVEVGPRRLGRRRAALDFVLDADAPGRHGRQRHGDHRRADVGVLGLRDGDRGAPARGGTPPGGGTPPPGGTPAARRRPAVDHHLPARAREGAQAASASRAPRRTPPASTWR